MPIIAKDNRDENFEPMPLGMQQAVCAFVEDIGTQEGSYFGKPTRNHQIIICWELEEKMTKGDNEGKPFMISKFYTLSLNEKANLCKDLESWRGKGFSAEEKAGFDVEKLIGANCFLNIIEVDKQDGSKRPAIASINPITKNMDKIEVYNTKPPAWIQDMRTRSIEWKEEKIIETELEDFASDEGLPF